MPWQAASEHQRPNTAKACLHRAVRRHQQKRPDCNAMGTTCEYNDRRLVRMPCPTKELPRRAQPLRDPRPAFSERFSLRAAIGTNVGDVWVRRTCGLFISKPDPPTPPDLPTFTPPGGPRTSARGELPGNRAQRRGRRGQAALSPEAIQLVGSMLPLHGAAARVQSHRQHPFHRPSH